MKFCQITVNIAIEYGESAYCTDMTTITMIVCLFGKLNSFFFNRFFVNHNVLLLALTVMDRCSLDKYIPKKKTSLICSCFRIGANFEIVCDLIKECMQILNEYQMSLTFSRFSGFVTSFALFFSFCVRSMLVSLWVCSHTKHIFMAWGRLLCHCEINKFIKTMGYSCAAAA